MYLIDFVSYASFFELLTTAYPRIRVSTYNYTYFIDYVMYRTDLLSNASLFELLTTAYPRIRVSTYNYTYFINYVMYRTDLLSNASLFELLTTAYPRIHLKIYLLYRLPHLCLGFTVTYFKGCVHLCRVLYIRGIVNIDVALRYRI